MKKYLILLFALVAIPSFAQSVKSVEGVVKTTENEVVPFASVYWIESGTYVDCDENGKFTIKRKSKDQTLAVAALGYDNDTLVVAEDVHFVEFFLKSQNYLQEAVVVARDQGNFLSKMTPVKTEVISAAGLCKMACCNLAESFENSASVTVGYSDAVTGARQIRLLGLSGIYTTMLDENRPIMRGIAAPFGLSYIPGQWLESIQVAKGPSSVINGVDAITGQINMEHRKPTDEKPFFLNLFLSSTLRTEMNIASSLQLNNKWSTVILAHASTDPMKHDGNGDGFRDDPTSMQFNFANRWLYYDESGLQVRFGVKALYDDRTGGQMSYNKSYIEDYGSKYFPGTTDIIPWGTNIVNKSINGYFKLGIPLNADNSHNIAAVGDYTFYQMDSYFALKSYFGKQNSGFLNIIYQGELNENHRINFGVRNFYDHYNESLFDMMEHGGVINRDNLLGSPVRVENSVGAYGEYTYTLGEKFSAIGGLSVDYHNLYGLMVSPRANIKWSITDYLIFRAQGGRGTRSPNVVVDNLGMMSTSRQIDIAPNLTMESAWTYGGNITGYIPIGFQDNCYLSFDYFRSDFTKQLIVDQEYDTQKISIYNLDGKSYTNTYQVDFSIEPIERFTVLATFRYTDSKVTLKGQGLVERPLVSKYKGVLNLQYATRMNIWTFDFTAQVNGPSRIPDFALKPGQSNQSPVYPILFAQVTRKFKGVDVYIGAENLTNYKQKNPIISADDPYAPDFNASVIWGPLMGIKVYAGMRLTLWK